MAKRILWVMCWLLPAAGWAQALSLRQIDSLNTLAFQLAQSSPFEANLQAQETYARAQQATYAAGMGKAALVLGLTWYVQGQPDSALHWYSLALLHRRQAGDSAGVASVFNNMAILHYSNANYGQALEYYLEALRITEQVQDSAGIAASQINLGTLYQVNGSYETALQYFRAAEAFHRRKKNNTALAGVLNNIGNTLDLMGNATQAMSTHRQVLGLRQQIGDAQGLAETYNNIGELHKRNARYDSARTYYKLSVELKTLLDDRPGLALAFNNLGIIARNTGDYAEAILLQERSLELANQTNNLEIEANATGELADLLARRGSLPQAVRFYRRYNVLRDSLANLKNLETVASLQARIKLQAQENTINLLEKDKALKELAAREAKAELDRNRSLIFFLLIAAVLTGVIAVITIRNARQQRRLNIILEENAKQIAEQRDELEAINVALNDQYKILDQKNKEITDSINYAFRIQKAILPNLQSVRSFFSDSMIFYRPRDIVSGDFYWFEQLNEDLAVLAVGDCVGHGVPGAFMTVLASSLLNEYVSEGKMSDPAKLLRELHQRIGYSMHYSSDNEDDTGGQLDLAIVLADRRNSMLSISNAKIPVLHCGANGTIELKGDRISIGQKQADVEIISEKTVALNPGEWVYLYSDGFPDQFGGPDRRKFMSKQLRNHLAAASTQGSGASQEAALATLFDEWRGSEAQTDDVLVFGFSL